MAALFTYTPPTDQNAREAENFATEDGQLRLRLDFPETPQGFIKLHQRVNQIALIVVEWLPVDRQEMSVGENGEAHRLFFSTDAELA